MTIQLEQYNLKSNFTQDHCQIVCDLCFEAVSLKINIKIYLTYVNTHNAVKHCLNILRRIKVMNGVCALIVDEETK